MKLGPRSSLRLATGLRTHTRPCFPSPLGSNAVTPQFISLLSFSHRFMACMYIPKKYFSLTGFQLWKMSVMLLNVTLDFSMEHHIANMQPVAVNHCS